jgi:putative membrane protein
MRNMITIINLAILFGITSIFSRPDKSKESEAGSEKSAEEVSKKSNEIGTIQSNFTVWPVQWSGDSEDESNAEASEGNKELAAFIKEMIDTKLVDVEHGKIATQRATKRSLKDYAAAMVKVQSDMRAELNTLAVKKKIMLPAELLKENAEELRDVHGESFDKKFISKVIKDHKRNVKKLERATRSKDAEVQVFATKYLPVVQSHLDQIKAIKKTY